MRVIDPFVHTAESIRSAGYAYFYGAVVPADVWHGFLRDILTQIRWWSTPRVILWRRPLSFRVEERSSTMLSAYIKSIQRRGPLDTEDNYDSVHYFLE